MRSKPIEVIVAATPDGEIGYKNTLPWRLKGDLKRFKELTMGNILIMGKNTYESLPGPLEGRTVIVVSKSLFTKVGEIPGDVFVTQSLPDALTLANRMKRGPTIFIAGGASLYESVLQWPAVKVHLTTVYKEAAEGYDTVIRNFNVLDTFQVIGEPIEVYDEVVDTLVHESPVASMYDKFSTWEKQKLSHTYTTLVSPQYHSRP
jgi:dihydrofolate reductase